MIVARFYGLGRRQDLIPSNDNRSTGRPLPAPFYDKSCFYEH